MTQQPTHQPSANDVLMGGGGAPTAKFTNPGDTNGGRIVAEPRAYQEREYDPRNPGNGALKFYPKSGDPIMSVSVDVQTDQRDPSIEEDDGVRRIYIEGKRLKDAVRDAVRNAGAKGLEVGGELHVTFTGLGEAENGMNAPKLYSARYVAASGAAANATLMAGGQDTTTPAAAAQQPTPAPAPATAAPAAAAPTGAPTPEDIATAKSLIAAGLDDATVTASAPSITPVILAALRNAA